MKPTLKQIFDFGLEIVEKETSQYIKSTGEYSKRFAKRYSKQVITHSCIIWFNHSKKDVSDIAKVSINKIEQYISIINKAQFKQEQSEELYNSLMYLNDKSFTTFRANILKDFKVIGGNINKSQTKLEKWLINRLYEIENK